MLLVKTRIGSSRIHGIGVFAEERIKQGQVVWVLDDRFDTRIPVSQLSALPKLVSVFLRTYGYQEIHEGERTLVLCGDHARHMNHSDHPNLVEAEVTFAARDIERGEELTCDYFTFDLDAGRKLSRRQRFRIRNRTASPHLSAAASNGTLKRLRVSR